MNRICKICGVEKKLSEFTKVKTCNLGYSWRCKECISLRSKEWYVNNLNRAKESRKEWRTHHVEFNKVYQQQYRKENVETIKEYKRKWAKDNFKHLKEYKFQYRKGNSDYVKAQINQWKKDNREIVNRINNARLHRVRAGGRLTRQMIEEVYRSCNYTCVKCGTKEKLSLDHIKPVVLGGSNALENLQILCMPCNLSKGVQYNTRLEVVYDRA